MAPVFLLIGREEAGAMVPPSHEEVEDASKEVRCSPDSLEVKTVGNGYSWVTYRSP